MNKGLPRSGRVFQYGYVVDDLERGMARWREIAPLGPFYLLENVEVQAGIYRGRPFELTMSAALAQWNGVQIELLYQNSSGLSALNERGAGEPCVLNHLGMLTEDIEGDIAFLEEQGHPVAMRGLVLGQMPFAYMDTVELIGHMLELVPADPAILEVFAEVEAAARDWDGRDPVRRL